MENQSITGLRAPANNVDPFVTAARDSGGTLPDRASTPDALHLSPEDAFVMRQQAERDLNATLHASAERVRYITGASGVALALCESEADEMVCRGSSGPTAPEVGTRMHIQSGITAESIRSRQTLRVDQASTDARVNQETCRALGIESVMVMPLIVGSSVVGIFELFGELPSAFGERDAKTLQGTAAGVQFALHRAVNSGFVLGQIPWAVIPDPLPEAGTKTGLEIGLLGAAQPNPVPTAEIAAEQNQPDLDEITLRTPVVFPGSQAAEEGDLEETGPPKHAEAVPAFLARLADEAKPSSTKRWSQWFRPQW